MVLLVGGWLAWRTLPTLLQKAGPLVEAACGSSSTTLPAASFTIGCAPIAPTVDGSFDDWRSVPSHDISAVVSGPKQDGLRATWQALWDSEALFLHADVSDAAHTAVDPSDPPRWWKGDAVSFEIGPDPRGLSRSERVREGDDFHVILALVDDGDRRAAADVNVVGPDRNGRPVFATGQPQPGIDVVARLTDSGYELEARIPWSEVGRTVAPARGEVVGLNVNVSDAQGSGAAWRLRTMLSSNPTRTAQDQNFPRRWQTAVLGSTG